jgi:DNA-binding NarL/FixJ family response regulator
VNRYPEEHMAQLRPIERRILAMRDQGLDVADIARRIRRSPQQVERIIRWTEIPRPQPRPPRTTRPIERRVLALRADGESHEQIAQRFRRSPGFIRRVEGLAHYSLAIHLLA